MKQSGKRRRGESVPKEAQREPMEIEVVFGPIEEDETAPPTTPPPAPEAKKARRHSQNRFLFRF